MMRHLVSLLVVALVAPCAFAAQVVKVKGKSVLVNLQGDAASAGETFFAMEGGKKKAIIKISKVKGDKAIGKILKGKAGAGMTLSPRGGGGGGGASNMAAASPTGSHSSGHTSGGRSFWGGMAGYAMDSMNVNINDFNDGHSLGSEALSGSGFSAKVLFDYELFSQVWFRGLGGVEMFNVSGASRCGEGNALTCDAKIMYASGDFIGRYVFSMGDFRPWLGFGISLMFPASKSATALASNSIGTTNALLPCAGVDIFMSPTMYIPLQVEYGMLPKSDEVDAHWIGLRAGIAVPF